MTTNTIDAKEINIGKQLRRFRNALDMTQPEVSAKIKKLDPTKKTTTKTIVAWEKGRSFPNAYELLLLCQIYNTTPDTIFLLNKRTI